MAAEARRAWTPEEDQRIRSWPKDRPWKELARELLRTEQTVRQRAYLLRSERKRGQNPPPDLTPAERKRLREFSLLLTVVERLRRDRTLRGPLAGPRWGSYLLDEFHRTNRERREGLGTKEGESYYRQILEQAARSIPEQEEQHDETL